VAFEVIFAHNSPNDYHEYWCFSLRKSCYCKLTAEFLRHDNDKPQNSNRQSKLFQEKGVLIIVLVKILATTISDSFWLKSFAMRFCFDKCEGITV